jgi:hypothetical protein
MNERRELAHRTSVDLDVTLAWTPGNNRLFVCVDDRRLGVSFEIFAAPYRALDVFNHPYAYRDH